MHRCLSCMCTVESTCCIMRSMQKLDPQMLWHKYIINTCVCPRIVPLVHKTSFHKSSTVHELARLRNVLSANWQVCKLTGSVPHYKTEKITHKASDTAENLQLYRVVQFFRPRSLCTMTHLMLLSERPPIYASCVTSRVKEPNGYRSLV